MSLLSAVVSVCRRAGIGVPQQVIGATDDMTLQLLELANESAEEITRRHGWQQLRAMFQFNTVGQAAQIASLPADFDRFAPGLTLWNLSTRMPLNGPVSPSDWARLQAFGVGTSTSYSWRLIGNQIALFPVPSAGQVVSYEYITANRIVAADGVTFRPTFAADTDSVRFPEHLLVKDLRWRWKAAKGLNYAEEMASFERAYELETAEDRGESNGISTADGPIRDDLADNTLNGFIAPTTVVVDGGLV